MKQIYKNLDNNVNQSHFYYIHWSFTYVYFVENNCVVFDSSVTAKNRFQLSQNNFTAISVDIKVSQLNICK